MTNADKAIPYVDFEIGGKTRRLLFSWEAICRYEIETGKSVLVPGAMENLRGYDWTVLLWASLLHDDPKLTLKEVTGWVTFENVSPVINAVTDAMLKARAPDEKKTDDPGE